MSTKNRFLGSHFSQKRERKTELQRSERLAQLLGETAIPVEPKESQPNLAQEKQKC